MNIFELKIQNFKDMDRWLYHEHQLRVGYRYIIEDIADTSPWGWQNRKWKIGDKVRYRYGRLIRNSKYDDFVFCSQMEEMYIALTPVK